MLHWADLSTSRYREGGGANAILSPYCFEGNGAKRNERMDTDMAWVGLWTRVGGRD